ncbi:hypothetical protein CKAH01_18418 [Colletotrichum kahawae]|uniref:Uncharacterized protein n=1 Tax=Colletotrichum kahawae TaxID=34407 RepID=A0AAE0D4H6_COLKA|nr:hypothetical protein CKAH01_18418 [Colletotrichum kahawae]
MPDIQDGTAASMVVAFSGKSMNIYVGREEGVNSFADLILSNTQHNDYAPLSSCSRFPSIKRAAMSCRSPTTLQLQKDVSNVLASFDKNVQDHINQLKSLDPLSTTRPDVFISDYSALGFTLLGDVDSAVEHLRGEIFKWTSLLGEWILSCRLEISPSYDPLETSAKPHAAPEPGFHHSAETMQGIAAELRNDRDITKPCVQTKSRPGSVGLFVESSIEASPVTSAQSPAESTIEVKPTEHTGHAVLATVTINGVSNTQPEAQLANHFLGPDLENPPSIAVGLASDTESPGILSFESNGEALHDDELIETCSYTDHNSHIKSINKLINIAVECVDARKLYCQNESHLRQRLSQFLPGTFVDDIILLHLLRMITEDSRFFVVDPLHLKLNEASPYPVFKAFSMDVDGLVFPINVNASDQMSSTNTNHWVIAVVHPHFPPTPHPTGTHC